MAKKAKCLKVTDGRTEGRTDGRTDNPSQRRPLVLKFCFGLNKVYGVLNSNKRDLAFLKVSSLTASHLKTMRTFDP